MDSPDFRKLSDEELLKKVQPGFTSVIDKYYHELAHSIVDNNSIYLGESATKEIGDLERDYEAAKSEYESKKTPENQVAMLKATINLISEQNELLKGRSAKIEPPKPLGKSSFVKGDVVGGLKTRRKKHRNGPSGIRRYRSRHMSTRKNKT